MTTYIFRMDDISPVMNWNSFFALLQLFSKHNVKPLLGIIPDNQDKRLSREPYRPNFWKTMRQLVADNLVDIAQHGYQHLLRPRYTQQIPKYLMPTRPFSEFAGDPLHIQVDKIRRGQRILLDEGLSTTYWMAPNHSLDRVTLRALWLLGFSTATDGIALHPFFDEGILFIPQQTWRPRWSPGGVQTICLHSDSITVSEIRRLRHFLRRPHIIERFSSIASLGDTFKTREVTNAVFRTPYKLARYAKTLKAPASQ